MLYCIISHYIILCYAMLCYIIFYYIILYIIILYYFILYYIILYYIILYYIILYSRNTLRHFTKVMLCCLIFFLQVITWNKVLSITQQRPIYVKIFAEFYRTEKFIMFFWSLSWAYCTYFRIFGEMRYGYLTFKTDDIILSLTLSKFLRSERERERAKSRPWSVYSVNDTIKCKK